MNRRSRYLILLTLALALGGIGAPAAAKQPEDRGKSDRDNGGRDYRDEGYVRERQDNGRRQDGRDRDRGYERDRGPYDPGYDRGPYNYDRPSDRRGGEGPGMSLDEAVGRAQQLTGGRVLSAGMGESDGRPVYRIKVLTPEGRVRTLIMDAGEGGWGR